MRKNSFLSKTVSDVVVQRAWAAALLGFLEGGTDPDLPRRRPGGGDAASPPSRAFPVGDCPPFSPAQADPPHLIQQATSAPAARATARAAAAAARSPALSRRRHLLCLRGSRALRLVARRLAGAGGLTYGAEPVGIRKGRAHAGVGGSGRGACRDL